MSRHFVTSLAVAAALVSVSACRNTQQAPPPPTAQTVPAAQPAQPPAGTAAPTEQTPVAQAAPAPSAATQAAPGTRAPVSPPMAAPAATAPAAVAAQPTQAGQAPPPAAEPPPAPVAPEPPKPEYREFTIPAGRTISVVLDTAVASDTSQVEDTVRAHTTQPITVDGHQLIPSRAKVTGAVTEAKGSAKVKGLARVAFRFTRIDAGEDDYRIQASPVVREAKATKSKDAKKIGIGAGVGAIVGGIAGGGKGAAIGAGVGGGAGTGLVMATKGEEVRLPVGSTVSFKLQEPLTVRVLVEP